MKELNPEEILEAAAKQEPKQVKNVTLKESKNALNEIDGEVEVVVSSTSKFAGNTICVGNRYIRLNKRVMLPKKIVKRIEEWRLGDGRKAYNVDYPQS